MSYTEEDIPKAWVVRTDVKPPTETVEAYSSTETVGADEAVSDAELVARGRSRANNRMKGRERGEGNEREVCCQRSIARVVYKNRGKA